MTIKISQAQIVAEGHSLNGEVRDILIENGSIVKVAKTIGPKADKTISASGLCVSAGWLDMRANFRDPGSEQKEDLDSGLKAASRGGFTGVAIMPSTQPAIDNKGAIKYILDRGSKSGLEIIPIGAITRGLKSDHLSEMYDMYLSGAKAFSDDKTTLTQSGLLQRALLYSTRFETPIMHFPYDSGLVPNAQMNEGVVSTKLGLRGGPALAEEMMVQRDLQILEYTGGKLHLGPLSSIKSLEQVASAKKKGLNVTSEVAMANLVFTDEEVESFDSNFKLLPPLRDSENLKKLIKAISKGQIDVISSDHSPEDEEHKKLEFDLAEFGLACIELFFPLLWNELHSKVELSKLVQCFTEGPRSILGLDQAELKVGSPANLTLFSIEESTDTRGFKPSSKAYNSIPVQKELKGRVVGTIRKGKLKINN